jgi:monofunctional biosynthetic peptidoglycan transglycosylase
MSRHAQPLSSTLALRADASPAEASAASHPASTVPSKHTRWWWVRRVFLAVLLLIAAYHAWIFAQVWWLRDHNPSTTAFMQQGLARLQEKNPKAQLQYRWLPYNRISDNLKRAVIAAEDQKFLDHDGFDWEAIEESYQRNLRRRRVVRGGSTISQQLAKNLFLSGQRNYLRKAQEAVFTLMIESALEKRRILEIYLNVIEWGNGVYGAEAAARHYYGVGAAELTQDQAAHLAAMIPNPRFYDRKRSTPGLERRAVWLRRYFHLIAVP